MKPDTGTHGPWKLLPLLEVKPPSGLRIQSGGSMPANSDPGSKPKYEFGSNFRVDRLRIPREVEGVIEIAARVHYPWIQS